MCNILAMLNKLNLMAEEAEQTSEGCDLQFLHLHERHIGTPESTRSIDKITTKLNVYPALSQPIQACPVQGYPQAGAILTSCCKISNTDEIYKANSISEKMNLTINNLPQEIYDLIVTHISDSIPGNEPASEDGEAEKHASRPSIARYSTISRRFQKSCEKFLYNSMRLNTTGDILQMQKIFTTAARRRSLRDIFIKPTSIPLILCAVRRKQKKKVELKLSRTISALMLMLHTWEIEKQELGIDCAESVTIRIDSPMISSWNKNCYHFRNHDWRLQLHDIEKLPFVHIVKNVIVTWNDEANGGAADFDGATIVALLAKFPCVHQACLILNDRMSVYMDRQNDKVHLNHGDYMGAWHGPRRAKRQLLGQKLEIPSLFSHLQVLMVDMKTRSDVFQDMGMPNLIAPQSYDVFSAGLRRASTNLRELYVTSSAINESLFWPTAAELAPGEELPTFPNMEIVCVAFSNSTPDGKWYFRGSEEDPQDEDLEPLVDDIDDDYPPPLSDARSHDEHESHQRDFPNHGNFRHIPNETHIKPLLEAFANAANHMPKLSAARLCTQVNELMLESVVLQLKNEDGETKGYMTQTYDHPDWKRQPCDPSTDEYKKGEVIARSWAVTYYGPGMICSGDKKRRLHWATDKWRPPAELRKLYRKIGAECSPGSMVEKFTPRLTCKQYHRWLPRAKWQKNWDNINPFYHETCQNNCFTRW